MCQLYLHYSTLFEFLTQKFSSVFWTFYAKMHTIPPPYAIISGLLGTGKDGGEGGGEGGGSYLNSMIGEAQVLKKLLMRA